MDEDRSLKKLANIFQGVPYLYIAIETFLYLFYDFTMFSVLGPIIIKLKQVFLFEDGNLLWSKTFGFVLILAASVGTKPKKSLEIKTAQYIVFPIFMGLLFYFGAVICYAIETNFDPDHISTLEITYLALTIIGAILIHIGADNISKVIRMGFMKDKFNVENESFQQPIKPLENDFSMNLPMSYYFNGKKRRGWFNLTNPFRGTMVIGTPESGKTFSIIIPFIKTFIEKRFTMILYDYKYPDLANVAYHRHQLNKRLPGYFHRFHVINLNDITRSRRVNPLSPKYLSGLPQCIETAEALIQALQKTTETQGADQFFRQSAINFLSAIFFFFSKFKDGKYSTLPHVLSFMNRSYKEIFDVLYQQAELESLLSPFKSAYQTKVYNQLEGQIGTLKINMSRLATPETYWVFSGEDFDLRISSPKSPSILVIANNPDTQNINSASNALILNRLTKLVNSKGNLPCAIVVDELPTIYFHQIQNLISTARSNKVAVMLGLQELPQLVESYGRNVAATITSVIGNVISGAVRKKETLDWLQQLFGRVKQLKKGVSITKTQTTTNLNEQMDYLIPASKIADQTTGEVVAKLASGFNQHKDNFTNLHTYNCKIEIDTVASKNEEKQYKPLPVYYQFENNKEQYKILMQNVERINADIEYVVQSATVNV